MVTVRSIRAKAGSEPITMLTAYDAPTAGVVDEAGIDIIFVGDNMGNTALGYDSTLSATTEDVASRTVVVACATNDALVVANMPFLSIGVNEMSSVEYCNRMLKEADADVVKLECSPHTIELTEHFIRLGVPVMAHLGLTPQRVRGAGYGRQGADRDDTQEAPDLAKTYAKAGAFSLVPKHIPANFAKQVTEAIDIPTIGIDAGPDCDGQMLVVDDVVGMSDHTPLFTTRFDDVKSEMEKMIGTHRDAAEAGEFPTNGHGHAEGDLDELY